MLQANLSAVFLAISADIKALWQAMPLIEGENGMGVLVFDTKPGNRVWVCKREGWYRLAVVGGGGGGGNINKQTRGGDGGGYAEITTLHVTVGQQYTYTVGAGGAIGAYGGTSSVSTLITATGGAPGQLATMPGIGIGGDINTNGGHGGISGGGGASGSRIGNGGDGKIGGGAWGQSCSNLSGASPQGDGFDLGIQIGTGGYVTSGSKDYSVNGGYGSGGSGGIDIPCDAGTGGGGGASVNANVPCSNPGIGGGGATHKTDCAFSSNGGNGAVIIKKL